MKMKLPLSIVFITIIFLSSCSGLKDLENYKGDNLSMSVGDTSSVKMYANTLQGYGWVVTANSDPTIAVYEATFIQLPKVSSDQTTQAIRFKGLKKGKTIITLNYVKKGDLLAKQSRTLNILVY